MEKQSEYVATQHAYKRAKERLGWKKRTVDNMMERAFKRGLKFTNTKGSLKKYVLKIRDRNKEVRAIRIYGENIFFFRKKKLITIYRTPNSLIKLLNICQKEKKAKDNGHITGFNR